MLVQNQIGPITATSSIAAGILAPQRAGNLGDTIVSELHGRYYETTYRRNMFSAQSGSTAIVAGLTTAVTGGLVLTNPIGSSVNLVLNKVGFAFTTVFAAVAAYGLASGYNSGVAVTQTTPVTPKNGFIGVGQAGQGLAATAVTLPTTPTALTILGSGLTGAVTTTPYITSFYDLEGSVIIPPGGYVLTYATAASAAGTYVSFQYEEVPT